MNLQAAIRLAAISWLWAACAAAEDWPQFRGPTGLGYTKAKDLPVEWGGSDAKNVAWKSPLVGQGHASPIVSRDRIFICTAAWDEGVQRREDVIPAHHVLCLKSENGERVWDTTIPPGPWKRSDFRSGPGGGYAAPTPATDGERVFVVFGSSVMAALDFDGKILWRKEITPHTFDVTIGSSPVLFGETVLLLHAMSNRNDSKLVAYDKATGDVRWESPMKSTGFAHSTPVLIDVDGKRQLVVLASGGGESDDGLISFDPADGKRIWWCRAGGDAASIAFGSGIVYADNGRGGPGVAVDPTGKENVTDTHIKWRVDQVPEGIGSPIIVNGLVYRLHNPNVLKCWRASDGKPMFAERLDGLSTTWASPIADPAGRIYFASAGKSYVIQAGEKFEKLAVNDLGDGNHPSPAVAGERLILVGEKQVWCVGK